MKVYTVKIQIEIEDEYDNHPNIEETIMEYINYPAMLPKFIKSKTIFSWLNWKKR